MTTNTSFSGPVLVATSSTRPRRLGRLAAGLTVAAAVTATALLGASPAYAQSEPGTVSSESGEVFILGTNFADDLTVRSAPVAGVGIDVFSSAGSILAGTGCTPLSASAVRCTGTKDLAFQGKAGDDVFTNLTSIPSFFLNGGAGDDTMVGGQGKDTIFGGPGFDKVSGSTGVDRCIAEVELRCELN